MPASCRASACSRWAGSTCAIRRRPTGRSRWPACAGRSARVLIEGAPGSGHAGWMGELHPRWQQKYGLPQPVVLFELEAESLVRAPLPRPWQPSKFPPVVRDIALLVDAGVAAQARLDAARGEKPPIVQEVGLFDLYQGRSLPPGKKSLA